MVTQTLAKAVNQPLGDGNMYQPREKRWIQLALAGASLASSLFGGAKAAKERREAERRQRAREAEENADYTRRRYEGYIDTAAGQNLIRRAKELYKSGWKKAKGAQAVGGGTEAATAMAQEAGNKMLGDTIANIAANDTARQDRLDERHQQSRDNFAKMDMQRHETNAQYITNASQNASNAMLTAASVLGQDSASTSNLAGGSNNSSELSPLSDAQRIAMAKGSSVFG